MGSKDYGFSDFEKQMEVNGKFICTGSFFVEGTHGRFKDNLKRVSVPEGNRIFLACISLNMLSAVGGDFDDADTIYADIFEIDGNDHFFMRIIQTFGGTLVIGLH